MVLATRSILSFWDVATNVFEGALGSLATNITVKPHTEILRLLVLSDRPHAGSDFVRPFIGLGLVVSVLVDVLDPWDPSLHQLGLPVNEVFGSFVHLPEAEGR